MEVIEEMKSRVSMRELLESYGIYPVRGTNIYKCPMHSDKKPSANIVKGCEKFHCFAENKTWDIFDFVQEMEKCDFKRATQIIDDKFNLGLLRELTHKEKLELARQRKLHEKQRAEKEWWANYEKSVLAEIVKWLRFWEQVETETHITRGEYRNVTWSEERSTLFFTALKHQRWLNWLYDAICGFDHPECEFDFVYSTNKRELLKKIKGGEIDIW